MIEFFAIGTAVVGANLGRASDRAARVDVAVGRIAARYQCSNAAEAIAPAGLCRRVSSSEAMPDMEIKPQVYKDPRPKEYFDEFHERVRDHEPEPVYEVVRAATVLNALITFRARGLGAQNVPNGPVILAPNHASFMDHFFTGAFIRRRVQFMGKSQLFGTGTPMSWIYSHGGVFPVRRGQHEEAFISAFASSSGEARS